ncbi:hypothetical protein Micbo1qcDRAFT_178303 [Microdochium bolleyi]|uniref:Uncharacterized protein n=1 Tax=Microdochium bolleyi TaxID=196109 RepID=A0A136ITE6_9PEZI|nr:hypothetical protein Micbo1qcDRAFT_178303 [Microdochium bolleyi]
MALVFCLIAIVVLLLCTICLCGSGCAQLYPDVDVGNLWPNGLAASEMANRVLLDPLAAGGSHAMAHYVLSSATSSPVRRLYHVETGLRIWVDLRRKYPQGRGYEHLKLIDDNIRYGFELLRIARELLSGRDKTVQAISLAATQASLP